MSDAVTADGSPVEAYVHLPAGPDLDVVQGLVAGRTTVLDLGCGVGRIADPLAIAGHRVVAVDESADMLAHVSHAEPYQSSIETLRLGKRFEAVLLLSHLINTRDPRPILVTAARHLAKRGLLVAQRLEPGRAWATGKTTLGPVTIELLDVATTPCGAELQVRGATRYSVNGRAWVQRWEMYERSDEQLRHLLRDVGLSLTVIDGIWLTAAG